jgi:hypothetical protein
VRRRCEQEAEEKGSGKMRRRRKIGKFRNSEMEK